MATERLEVRLRPERRRKLKELSATRGETVSDVVRKMIDDAYEEIVRERRTGAAKAIAEMQIQDLPDPETLGRELAETHDPGIP